MVRHVVELRTSWYVGSYFASEALSVSIAYYCGDFQRLYDIPSDVKLELLSELELDKDEDAPMSMAADISVGGKAFQPELELKKIPGCTNYLWHKQFNRKAE